jgi:hypothetical protein
MNIAYLTIVFYMLSQLAMSQSASVERSVFGIQAGWGIWIHQESRLANQLALRSELGVHTRIRGGNLYEKPKFVMSPVLTLEPRWYYNLDNRVRKEKRIDGNSGDFVSLKASWHPDWFRNSTADNINNLSDVALVPTWGLRRHIGQHITFETGIGVGVRLVFAEYAGVRENEFKSVVNLNIRIGYRIQN